MKIKLVETIKLFFWIIILLIVSALLGNLTQTDVKIWYKTLNQSPLTPPNYTFPIVWSILYILIGIYGWYIWNKVLLNNSLKIVKILFILQLLLNWIWTPLFFKFKLTGVSLIDILFLDVCVLFLILKSNKYKIKLTILLYPYLLWILFASYLNLYIWQNN